MIKLKNILLEGIVTENEWKAFKPENGDFFVTDMGGSTYVEVIVIMDATAKKRFVEDYSCTVKRYHGEPSGNTLKYIEQTTMWLSTLCSLTRGSVKKNKPDGKLNDVVFEMVKQNANIKLSDID